MYNPLFRALCIGVSAILLAGSTACDDGGTTSAANSAATQSRLSNGARFAGTSTSTLELKKADGGLQSIALSRSHFDLSMQNGKRNGTSRHTGEGRLFMLRDGATARGVQSQEQEFSFNDRQGHRHSLRIQRATGNGPISRVKHYRDGALVAQSVRSWRSVRGGWIATGSTLEVMNDGEIVGRLNSSVHATELATREEEVSGLNRLFALADALGPAELQAQSISNCQSQISDYAEASAELAVLIVVRVVMPVFGPSFEQIGEAIERYEQATTELQRCLTQPGI